MKIIITVLPLLCASPAVAFVAANRAMPGIDRSPAKHVIDKSRWEVGKELTAAPESMVSGVAGNDKIRREFEKMCRQAQADIIAAVEDLDGGAKFGEAIWERTDGGGGISRVLQDGNVFEKAGCSFSVVYGKMKPEAQKAATGDNRLGQKPLEGVDKVRAELTEEVPFFAAGLSSVMHPRNPHAPTMHFNYRYFETDNGKWWFGGGTDITPSYLYEEDMAHFHGTLKAVCDRHNEEFYPKFKKWADEYFVSAHRGETRGLGGIFFDNFNSMTPEEHLAFSGDLAANVCEAYLPIVEKRKDQPFTEKQKEWQQMRRGRYVEFNLVYDRGTIFGLKTGGRVESILMSMPLTARWQYDHIPEAGSPEADIMDAFRSPRDWL